MRNGSAAQIIGQEPAAGTRTQTSGSIQLIISLGPSTTVLNIVGLTLFAATERIVDAGLTPGAITVAYSETIPAAQVTGQNPSARTEVSADSAVAIEVSGGLPPIPAPDVVGMTLDAASETIAAAGFEVGILTEEYSSDVSAGRVIRQDPIAGEGLSPGSSVSLVISKGPEPVTVPNVVGISRTAAESAITEAALLLGEVTEEFSGTVARGFVIRQNPAAGTTLPSGASVSLVVSRGIQMVTVPDLANLTLPTAESAIDAAGLTVGTLTEQFSDTVPIGLVITQSPAANAVVPLDSAVSLVLSIGPESSELTESVDEVGATLVLDDATLTVPPESLDERLDLTLRRNGLGSRVEAASNEQRVTQVYSLEHGNSFPVTSVGGVFTYALTFDPDAIELEEGETLNDANLYFRVTTRDASIRLTGVLGTNSLQISLSTLFPRADLQIVYNPTMRSVFSAQESAKILTQEGDWRTTRFRCTYDWTDVALQRTVARIRDIDQSSVTEAIIAEVLQQEVANKGRNRTNFFQGLGLREADLRVGTGTSPYFDIHVDSFRSGAHFTDSGTSWGQLHLDNTDFDSGTDGSAATVGSLLSHELFHACVNGYNLQMGPSNSYLLGIEEGLAALTGLTADSGSITLPSGAPHLLGTSLGDADVICTDTPPCTYTADDLSTSSDWFAYIGKRFDGDRLTYLGGNGVTESGESNEALEQLRILNTQAGEPSDAEDALSIVREALHASLTSQFDQPLSEVYWDYARNRAYERNDESRLRPEDASTPRFSLDTALFSEGHIAEYTMTSDEQTLSLSHTESDVLRDIPPMTTRALVFRTSGFIADVAFTFNSGDWTPGSLGNAMMVKAYKEGSNGEELGSGSDTIHLNSFGDSGSIVILLSNVSVDQTYSLEVEAWTAVATGGIESLSGRVTNADTESPISAVDVAVRGQNANDTDEVIATTTTGSNGQFSLDELPSGYVEFTFSKAGYVTTIQTAVVVLDTETQMNASLIVAGTSEAVGDASGTVIDTVTGIGISGVTLDLRSGILRLRDTDRPVAMTTSTVSGGGYSFTGLNAGTYTAFASKSGYVDDIFVVYVVGGSARDEQKGDMSTTVSFGQIRIVLTWGEVPFDLDSHLTGPSGSGRFHVYFANPVTGGADLDLDDVFSFGPETTTIRSRIAGTYRFSVHDYSNLASFTSRAMSNSGTNVKVISGAGTVEFNITPDTPATLWTVFEIDGDTGAITEVDEYSFTSSPGGVSKALGWRYGLGSEVPTIAKGLPAKD